jgi:DNA-binding NarL/FixJ family response regulator
MADPLKKISVIIVADNLLFAEMLKESMVCCFDKESVVKTMNSSEMLYKEIESNRLNPDVIVLDYELNKQEGEEFGCKEIISHIKRISPETPIVVISDEKEMQEAAKTLEYGATEYVTKDKFAFSHITNAVKSVLNPSKS